MTSSNAPVAGRRELVDGLVASIKGFVHRANDPLIDLIAELERRIEALETREERTNG